MDKEQAGGHYMRAFGENKMPIYLGRPKEI
jgi:hypothetical protein